MGGSSSNLKNAFVYEIDDTIVKEGGGNYVQLNFGNVNTQNAVNGCSYLGDLPKYSGGQNLIDLTGSEVKTGSNCDKIEHEKYYSTCFLTPKNISVKGVDNPEKCKILYKAELKCEGDDETGNPCEIVPMNGTPEENENKCITSSVIDKYKKKWNCVYSAKDNICNSIEPFVNKSDNNMLCIIIAIVLLIVFLYL